MKLELLRTVDVNPQVTVGHRRRTWQAYIELRFRSFTARENLVSKLQGGPKKRGHSVI